MRCQYNTERKTFLYIIVILYIIKYLYQIYTVISSHKCHLHKFKVILTSICIIHKMRDVRDQKGCLQF